VTRQLVKSGTTSRDSYPTIISSETDHIANSKKYSTEITYHRNGDVWCKRHNRTI